MSELSQFIKKNEDEIMEFAAVLITLVLMISSVVFGLLDVLLATGISVLITIGLIDVLDKEYYDVNEG